MKKKMTLKQVRTIIFGLILVVSSFGAGFFYAKKAFSSEENSSLFTIDRKTSIGKEQGFSLFWDVWDRLEKDFLNKAALVSKTMVNGAIKGMVASLDDPYTVYLEPKENKYSKEDLSGEFYGVGIQLGYRDGYLAVIAPLSGMPAEKQGIKAGDFIVKVDGNDMTDVSLPEAVTMIRGPNGTKVKLTMLRAGEPDTFDVEIVRQVIIVPSVELKFLEASGGEKIAHLKLTRFGDKTDEEWLKAVDEILKDENLKGVILDLRNNPGGYLKGAVFIASEFLSSGVVVSQEGSKEETQTYSVSRSGKITEQKLVVLVNEGSASASEIVAGAIQDHNRAKIVGVKTFGKGTVQEASDLPGGAGIHITVAHWLLPNGASIDKEGITPDVEVEDNIETEDVDEQLQKALEILGN
ncbi:MAG: S41 family peptidase [Patescibacteria group bacterium]